MSALLVGQAFYVPLDQSSKLLLLALADHADETGRSARPGRERLAAKIGVSVRTVTRALQHLEEHGLISADFHRLGGRGNATEWRVSVGLLSAWYSAYQTDPEGWLERVTTCHCLSAKGCHLDPERVTPGALKGDTALSPQPSEPPMNRGKGDKLTPFVEPPPGGWVEEFRRRVAGQSGGAA